MATATTFTAAISRLCVEYGVQPAKYKEDKGEYKCDVLFAAGYFNLSSQETFDLHVAFELSDLSFYGRFPSTLNPGTEVLNLLLKFGQDLSSAEYKKIREIILYGMSAEDDAQEKLARMRAML